MGYDLAVHGLIRKRAEMASEVTRRRAELVALMAQLDSIDSAIRVFKPDLELEDLPERLVTAPFAGFRGEIRRFILDALRTSNEPLSTFDLADRVMDKRGLDRSDQIALKLIRRRTGYAMAKMRKQGVVTSWRAHGTAPMTWCLQIER